ncbi:phosphatase PAP2 family protein [Parapusillimonas sp. SGNA-6]|nr:phosphatase PAP2 family protein [Parapusillimonas sp. SGNA-6]
MSPATWLRFLRNRLAPGSYLGLQLTCGALVMIAASWVFGSIADEVLEESEFVTVDHNMSRWLNRLSAPWLTDIMMAISDMHGTRGISVLMVLALLVLAWKRLWSWAMILLVTVPSGGLLNVLMKQAFQRARPQFDPPLLMLTDYSFPSGHTCASTLFYGVMASLLVPRIASWRTRSLVVAVMLGMVALVAFSRLYLGAHFLSDVLAGFAEGVAWLALCLTATHTYLGHRAWKRARR